LHIQKKHLGKIRIQILLRKKLILYNINIDSPSMSVVQEEIKSATGNIQSLEQTNLSFIALGLFLLEQYIEVRSSG
jgi:hypothetical protein